MQNVRDHQKGVEEEVDAVLMPNVQTTQAAKMKITYTTVSATQVSRGMENFAREVCLYRVLLYLCCNFFMRL